MILKSEFHAAFFKTITMFRCWILKSGSIVELDDEITLSYKKVWYNDEDKEIQI